MEEWRPDIERAVLVRIQEIGDPGPLEDPEYGAGLRSALSATLGYAIACIGRGEALPPRIPPELLAQAGNAARRGISLDTVLRRCLAGNSLLGDFVIEAARDGDSLCDAELQSALRAKSALFDCLLATISDEYRREARSRRRGAEQRRLERVQRLLAGERLDAGELRYELDAWHFAAIASGPGAEDAVRDIATALDRRLLLIRASEQTIWLWFGGRRRISAREAVRLATPSNWPAGASLAFGEPEHGLDGWRLTHRQALAAMSVARHEHRAITCYGNVSLVASMLQDDVLTQSLRDRYLSPLIDERDGGQTLRQTLRAYFTAERNASSAASALEVSRRTVANRLQVIEERLGRPLGSCSAEMEAALRLDELDIFPAD